MNDSNGKSILIIGAGLSGLVAANVLHDAGWRVRVVDAGDAVGGRVRSDVVEGFILDRGFQVLLDSFPSVEKYLNLPALNVRYFDSGALLTDGRNFDRILHPFRHPDWLLSTALTPAFSWLDKFAFASLVWSSVAHPDAAILSRVTSSMDETTSALLHRMGISDGMIARFLRPFFAGVFLDDSFETSAALFRYYLKKFTLGRACIPAAGMGAIPAQLAGKLPSGAIRLNTEIVQLETSETKATVAIASTGERFESDQFLLATDEPSACRLLGLPAAAARPALGVATVYLRSRQSLYSGGLLVLPASTPDRLTLHLVQLSNVAPELAPQPWHLISVTVLRTEGLDDSQLGDRVLLEVGSIFTEGRGQMEVLKVVRTPYAQFRQHPQDFLSRPQFQLPRNLLLAGDQTGTCSIDAAMSAGANAAVRFLGFL